MSQQPDPAQLAEAVKGLSDDQLKSEIDNLGTDNVLQQIFDGMQQAFLPEKAGSDRAVIQYDIDTGDGVQSWTVDVHDGQCTTSKGAAENPRLTLQLKLTDFVRLIFGQADGTQLFMSGRMKLKGDMMFAMKMQTMFDRPA